jgi:low affinity Fe/Cu permease
MKTINNWLAGLAQNTAKATGSSQAFLIVCALTLICLVTGPFFAGATNGN